jgi:hypothetical protein
MRIDGRHALFLIPLPRDRSWTAIPEETYRYWMWERAEIVDGNTGSWPSAPTVIIDVFRIWIETKILNVINETQFVTQRPSVTVVDVDTPCRCTGQGSCTASRRHIYLQTSPPTPYRTARPYHCSRPCSALET